jgi:hypothetical protein
MKVVGTGSPRMLTVRFDQCELPLLRDEVAERQRSLVSTLAEMTTPHMAGDDDGERLKDKLVLLTRLEDDLRGPVEPDQPYEVTGLTELMADVIRGAAGEAVYQLQQDVERFREDRGTPTGQELRARLSTASAAIESLIGLDHALNHGIE